MKRIKRLRKWLQDLPATISRRYLSEYHPRFMELMQKNNLFDKQVYRDISMERARDILKILSSPKYKRFYYKVVQYNPTIPSDPVIPKNKFKAFLDRVWYNISKAYVFLFHKDLYRKIKSFEAVSAGIVSLNKRMDEYMATTTVDERLARANVFGLVTEKQMEAQVRLRKHQASRMAKIHAHNLE